MNRRQFLKSGLFLLACGVRAYLPHRIRTVKKKTIKDSRLLSFPLTFGAPINGLQQKIYLPSVEK